MPANLLVGQTIIATAIETDAAGLPYTYAAGEIAFSADSATFATMVDNGDGTATFTAIAPGTVNVTATDSKFSLVATDQLTVAAPPDTPTTLSISWGTPK